MTFEDDFKKELILMGLKIGIIPKETIIVLEKKYIDRQKVKEAIEDIKYIAENTEYVVNANDLLERLGLDK